MFPHRKILNLWSGDLDKVVRKKKQDKTWSESPFRSICSVDSDTLYGVWTSAVIGTLMFLDVLNIASVFGTSDIIWTSGDLRGVECFGRVKDV